VKLRVAVRETAFLLIVLKMEEVKNEMEGNAKISEFRSLDI
jgi:hypothetical protein